MAPASQVQAKKRARGWRYFMLSHQGGSEVWWVAFLFTVLFGAFKPLSHRWHSLMPARGILGAVFVSLLMVLYQAHVAMSS